MRIAVLEAFQANQAQVVSCPVKAFGTRHALGRHRTGSELADDFFPRRRIGPHLLDIQTKAFASLLVPDDVEGDRQDVSLERVFRDLFPIGDVNDPTRKIPSRARGSSSGPTA